MASGGLDPGKSDHTAAMADDPRINRMYWSELEKLSDRGARSKVRDEFRAQQEPDLMGDILPPSKFKTGTLGKRPYVGLNPAKMTLPSYLLTPANTAVDVAEEILVDFVPAVSHIPHIRSLADHPPFGGESVVRSVNRMHPPVMARPSFATSSFMGDDAFVTHNTATQQNVMDYDKGNTGLSDLSAMKDFVEQRFRVMKEEKPGLSTNISQWSNRQPTPVPYKTEKEDIEVSHTRGEVEPEVQPKGTHDPEMNLITEELFRLSIGSYNDDLDVFSRIVGFKLDKAGGSSFLRDSARDLWLSVGNSAHMVAGLTLGRLRPFYQDCWDQLVTKESLTMKHIGALEENWFEAVTSEETDDRKDSRFRKTKGELIRNLDSLEQELIDTRLTGEETRAKFNEDSDKQWSDLKRAEAATRLCEDQLESGRLRYDELQIRYGDLLSSYEKVFRLCTAQTSELKAQKSRLGNLHSTPAPRDIAIVDSSETRDNQDRLSRIRDDHADVLSRIESKVRGSGVAFDTRSYIEPVIRSPHPAPEPAPLPSSEERRAGARDGILRIVTDSIHPSHSASNVEVARGGRKFKANLSNFGDNPEKDDLEEWLEKVDDCAALDRWDDNDKVVQVSAKVTKEARSLLRDSNLLRVGPYEEIVRVLRGYYNSREVKVHARHELQVLVRGKNELIQTYVRRFKDLYNKGNEGDLKSNDTPSWVLDIFIRSLRDDKLELILFEKQYQSLDKVVEKIRRIALADRALRLRTNTDRSTDRGKSSGSAKIAAYQDRPNSNQNQNRDWNTKKQSASPDRRSSDDRYSNSDQRTSREASNICARCGSRGHYPRQCAADFRIDNGHPIRPYDEYVTSVTSRGRSNYHNNQSARGGRPPRRPRSTSRQGRGRGRGQDRDKEKERSDGPGPPRSPPNSPPRGEPKEKAPSEKHKSGN